MHVIDSVLWNGLGVCLFLVAFVVLGYIYNAKCTG